jgi:prepilin peptidase CpaA
MRVSIASELALGIYVFPLAMAAVSDFCSLRIPNKLTGALAAGFPAVALVMGHDVAWMSHLAAGLGVFFIAALLFALRVMGGGDVKLLAAVALWTGLGQLVPFLVLTALVGGFFALAVMLLRSPVVQATCIAVLRRLPAFVQHEAPIPYGIPIAVAGILMAPSLSFLA